MVRSTLNSVKHQNLLHVVNLIIYFWLVSRNSLSLLLLFLKNPFWKFFIEFLLLVIIQAVRY